LLLGFHVAIAQEITTPQIFAPDVISTGHEFTITFTPDGQTAYFTRSAKGQPLHILSSHRVDGIWQAPQKVSFSSDTWSDLDPFLTADGQRLFFVSTRPANAAEAPTRNMDLWVTERSGNDWAVPHPIENVNSSGKEGSPTVTRTGTLYFFSDRGRDANLNSLYESKFVNGRYTAPLALPAPINSTASDTSPWVSPNGKLLLFYSNRPGGLGKADLYAAFSKHGKWLAPINLGPTVNNGDSDYNPSLSPDGKQFYFGRNGNTYVIPTAVIPALAHLKL